MNAPSKRPFPWLTLLAILGLGFQGVMAERSADRWKKIAIEATDTARAIAKQRDESQANTDAAVGLTTTYRNLDERCLVAAEKLRRMLDACESK